MNFEFWRASRAKRQTARDRTINVLVYLIGSLGDTIITIPALRAVRRHFPTANLIIFHDSQLDRRVSPLSVIPDDLANEYLSYVNYGERVKKLWEMRRIWRVVRSKKIEAAVYLAPSERPATAVRRDKWFFRLCGIRNLIGFKPFTRQQLYPVDDYGLPAVTENEAIRKLWRLQWDGIKIDEIKDVQPPLISLFVQETARVREWLNLRRQKPAARLIAICPGCKTVANNWTHENFSEIGKRLLKAFDCEIVIAGSQTEHRAGERLINDWGAGINACGEFSVRESAALFAECEFVVSLDTGTIHLAAAVDVPCVGIYGERNNPGNWYPLGERHLIVYHRVECAGCRAQVCPVAGHPCLRGITPDALWQTMRAHGFDGEAAPQLSQTKRIAV